MYALVQADVLRSRTEILAVGEVKTIGAEVESWVEVGNLV